MKKVAHMILTVLICIFALSCVYLSAILAISAGLMFGDINDTETQRQAAQVKTTIFSLFCFLGFCASLAVLFLSRWISRFILKLIGIRDAA